MVIEYPKEYKLRNLHTIWAELSNINQKSLEHNRITLDLSNVRYIDAQGLNHIALLPSFLSKAGCDISIVLPDNYQVLSFMYSYRLMDILEDRYEILGVEKAHPSRVPYRSPSNDYNVHTDWMGNGTQLLTSSEGYRFFEEWPLDTAFRAEVFPDLNNVVVSMMELMRNVYDHSGENVGALTFISKGGWEENPDTLEVYLAIADFGIGIRNSFLKYAVESNLLSIRDMSDADIILYAGTSGVSGTGISQRGSGLTFAIEHSHHCTIHSGTGRYRFDNIKQRTSPSEIPRMEGTSIQLTFLGRNYSNERPGGEF